MVYQAGVKFIVRKTTNKFIKFNGTMKIVYNFTNSVNDLTTLFLEIITSIKSINTLINHNNYREYICIYLRIIIQK